MSTLASLFSLFNRERGRKSLASPTSTSRRYLLTIIRTRCPSHRTANRRAHPLLANSSWRPAGPPSLPLFAR